MHEVSGQQDHTAVGGHKPGILRLYGKPHRRRRRLAFSGYLLSPCRPWIYYARSSADSELTHPEVVRSDKGVREKGIQPGVRPSPLAKSPEAFAPFAEMGFLALWAAPYRCSRV